MNGFNAALTAGIAEGLVAWNNFNAAILSAIGNTFEQVIRSVVAGTTGVIAALNLAAIGLGQKGFEVPIGLGQLGGGAIELNRGFQADITAKRDAANAMAIGESNAAFAKLGKTAAEIAKLGEVAKVVRENKFKNSGFIVSPTERVSDSIGATISSNAAMLAFAAPGNATVQEKQLDVLQQINKGIDDMIDGLGGLEGLQAD